MNLSAVILAGGESKRMGQDKAWMKFDGRPLIQHAIDKARALGALEVFVSGRPGTDYGGLGCPVLVDRESGMGPLGGIERALSVCTAPMLLVLAVDLPRMTTRFLARLLETCDADVGAVPVLTAKFEPLSALYPKPCHEIVENAIKGGLLSAQGFAEACLVEGFVRAYPVAAEDSDSFSNWNTMEDAGGKVEG